jgi:hypothetical protein
LLQVQRNWFACNWRKVSPDAEYSRWPLRRKAFDRWFGTFVNFLGEQNLGDLRPVQCEVTYINHIAPNQIWAGHGEMDRVLSVIGRAGYPLAEPEETSFRSRHIITHGDKPVGRLHVQCDPVINTKDGSPAFLLNLTARGVPLSASREGVLGFLDLGRRWIVEGFKALTTREMHTAWGLHDE